MPANKSQRYYIQDGQAYADTAALNILGHEYHYAVDHLGFGDFRVTTDQGPVDFIRRDGSIEWEGMSGRPHLLSGNESAKLVLVATLDLHSKMPVPA